MSTTYREESERLNEYDERTHVKALRKDIDALIQETEKVGGFGKSRALAVVKTKLEEAKMWGGKRLEEINPSDYPAELADKAE